MAKILIIDDDRLVRKSLSRLFLDMDHQIYLAESIYEGLQEANRGVDVVFLDLDLPDGDGLSIIDELAASPSQPEIIVITGMGSSYGAQKTMESSAWDYISKPASSQMVISSLESALVYRKKAKKGHIQVSEFERAGIVGQSPALLRTLQDIEKAAMSDASVLIKGETGVGKELAAKALHLNSSRKNAPFVVVDCSNLSESLMESTLYGHVKGAFTDAHTSQQGLVALADGGTLFLDEIGELPLSQQKAFLRVLQERKYRPVGSAKESVSDFRLVAATNRNLLQMAEEGSFRSDLLFRIKTLEIIVPTLMERILDMDDLIAYFLQQSCDRYGIEAKASSRELLRVARSYGWPGNIRELQSVLEAAVIQSGSDKIVYPKHLPATIRMAFLDVASSSLATTDSATSPAAHSLLLAKGDPGPYSDFKTRCDKEYFAKLMGFTDYDVPRASAISGLSIPTVYRYLGQTGLKKKRQDKG